MISLKKNYAAVHGQFLEKHYGSDLYKASDKSVVVEKLQKYTINFKNGVMNADATNTSGYVFLKLDDKSELELYKTKLDKTPMKTEVGSFTCQPIAEDKRGDFQFIYTEIAKVIPYLDHLMEEFAKTQNERMKLDIVRFDGTNVTTAEIGLTKKIEVECPPTKSQVRIFEKTGIKYNYDFRRVLDEARGSFICQDIKEVNGVYFTFAKFLEARGCRILRVKNRFLETCGKSDYADILFNVEINDTEHTPQEFKDTFLSGTIAEVQIHIKAFKIIKNQSHEVYEKFRAIPGSAKAVAEIALKAKNTNKQLKKNQKETLKLRRQQTAILPAEIDGLEERLNGMGDDALDELNLADTENDPDFEH